MNTFPLFSNTHLLRMIRVGLPASFITRDEQSSMGSRGLQSRSEIRSSDKHPACSIRNGLASVLLKVNIVPSWTRDRCTEGCEAQ